MSYINHVTAAFIGIKKLKDWFIQELLQVVAEERMPIEFYTANKLKKYHLASKFLANILLVSFSIKQHPTSLKATCVVLNRTFHFLSEQRKAWNLNMWNREGESGVKSVLPRKSLKRADTCVKEGFKMSLKLMLHAEPLIPLTGDGQLFCFPLCLMQKRSQMFTKTSWLHLRLWNSLVL